MFKAYSCEPPYMSIQFGMEILFTTLLPEWLDFIDVGSFHFLTCPFMSFPFPFHVLSCNLSWKVPQIQKQQEVFLIKPLIEKVFKSSLLKSIGQGGTPTKNPKEW